MCRWLAYVGSPVTLDTVLTRPDHSLIDQSHFARRSQLPGLGAVPTNGDGFGVAWHGRGGRIGRYRSVRPAWNDTNLQQLAPQIASGCFLAHVRAAIGGTVAVTNTHPFVHDGWMFVHNGEIGGFAAVRRDLMLEVDPALFPAFEGSTDTEVCFLLALTYGLAADPVAGLRAMVERVERARAERGVPAPFRATIAASDGTRVVVLRHVSPGASVPAPSLFHSVGATGLHTAAGEIEPLPADAQIVVSEPLELHYSRRHWAPVPDDSITTFVRGAQPVPG